MQWTLNFYKYNCVMQSALNNNKNGKIVFKICLKNVKKTLSFFSSFSFRAVLPFPLWMPDALVYLNTEQGIHKGKIKVARNGILRYQKAMVVYLNIKYWKAFSWTHVERKPLICVSSPQINCNFLWIFGVL